MLEVIHEHVEVYGWYDIWVKTCNNSCNVGTLLINRWINMEMEKDGGQRTQSPPWTAYFLYPRTFVIK